MGIRYQLILLAAAVATVTSQLSNLRVPPGALVEVGKLITWLPCNFVQSARMNTFSEAYPNVVIYYLSRMHWLTRNISPDVCLRHVRVV